MESVYAELRKSAIELGYYGLKQSSSFSAGLLYACAKKTNSVLPKYDFSDAYLVAKSLMDIGEYRRASFVLEAENDFNSLNFFVQYYALYLANEGNQAESEVQGKIDSESKLVLDQLHEVLMGRYERNELDGFGLYLFGMVLKKMHRVEKVQEGVVNNFVVPMCTAKQILVESIVAYPYNWSAWLDLAKCLSNAEELHGLFEKIPCGWMYEFFKAHVLLENQQNDAAAKIYKQLLITFPTSSYLKAQMGVIQYNLRNFDAAQEEFEKLMKEDPYRMDSIDVYSNVLYVKESKAELSRLAHTSLQLNKYRPETCCVIGNYYSLKAKHDRAVLYFQRALRLDPNYLAAWTLIGHEYVELKNIPAAIEAYRRAVDICPHDYRAWYGLGQTYEILQMEYYALYYFQKAAKLRPFDARMWCAMAGCYQRLERRSDAILCYERAICNNDREGIAAVQLAVLYRDSDNREQAAKYFALHLEHREMFGGTEGQETLDAILFMAVYYKDKRRFSEASQLCSQLMDRPGPEKDEAKALMRELRSMAQDSGGDSSMSIDQSFVSG